MLNSVYNSGYEGVVAHLGTLTTNMQEHDMADDIIVPIGAKAIPLSKGKFAIVDEDDFEHLSQWKWHCNKSGYAARMQYVCYIGKRKIQNMIHMHREVMKTPIGMVVDHIDGNKVDNRKINLRNCTESENQKNRLKHAKNTSSKYKGVYFHKHKKKWYAHIKYSGKHHHLGSFVNENDAAIAYNNAALEHHGEYASLNTIED